MDSKGMLWLISAGGLSLAAFGQNAPRTVLIPSDPLEMVTGRVQAVNTPAARAAIVRLLGRARNSYALRSEGLGYDLKVTFTVNSGGRTEYDGDWEMEDVFDPKQGFRWTAKASAGYAITRISANGMVYGEETGSHIPLRLHEARAALFDPIPSPERVARAAMRTSTAMFQGAQLTCVLLSGSINPIRAASGRRWDETEECIDPESGLLQVHSQLPGRYYAYDYSDAPRLADHVLPRKVTVTEAAKVVTEISVDSLAELPAADPNLFAPTEEMKARGRPPGMAGAQKIWRPSAGGPVAPGATARAVCVFGVVTPSGELVEAHSLEPSDPNSQAAVAAAKQMSFDNLTPPGRNPAQHFVFVIEEFVASQ